MYVFVTFIEKMDKNTPRKYNQFGFSLIQPSFVKLVQLALSPCRNIKWFGQMRQYQKILILAL